MTFRQTFVVHNRHAFHSCRENAAVHSRNGRLILTIGHLAARLAGGFLQPIERTSLQNVIRNVLQAGDLGELDSLDEFPGLQRAVTQSLTKVWNAGLDLAGLLESEKRPEVKCRLDALMTIEKRILANLPHSMRRPRDLVECAMTRAHYGERLFGPITLQGFTELSPVWRPLLKAISNYTRLVWVAGPRHVPEWVSEIGIDIERSSEKRPEIRVESCASPRHEILEAFRWARDLISNHNVHPYEIAIVCASPKEWDDHVMALANLSGLPIHFVHGHEVLANRDGQSVAALSEVLLRGFNRARMIRLVSLLRLNNKRFADLPSNWWRVLPENAPMLEADRWHKLLNETTSDRFPDKKDHAPLLLELIETICLGLEQASVIGEALLSNRGLTIWQKALQEGPPAALDVTLKTMRMDDGTEPGEAIIWGPADALASTPRSYARLIGLTSRSWPRAAAEDPLIPEHIVPAFKLDPLPVHEADRRDFDTILKTTSNQVVLSRSRRGADGRQIGISPLFAQYSGTELYLKRARIPEHAANESDRLLARPDEFKKLARSKSAVTCWDNWNSNRLTPHDGLVSAGHPIVLRAVARRQSATSLSKLLRDPLGYLWTYAFNWREPVETDEPLQLDPLLTGNLLHAVLENTVNRIEKEVGGFAECEESTIRGAIDVAINSIETIWADSQPVPPPILWKLYLKEIAHLATRALLVDENPLPGQKSFVEVPFGGQIPTFSEGGTSCPWSPDSPVVIPGTDIAIGGIIDRLDLSGDNKIARVTDYKSGRVPKETPGLKGGAELQRCLYAFAVRCLLGDGVKVDARLLYPKSEFDGLMPLDDAEALLEDLSSFIVEARDSFLAGNSLPGAGTEEKWNDLSFALPGGVSQIYFERKRALASKKLDRLPILWEMP